MRKCLGWSYLVHLSVHQLLADDDKWLKTNKVYKKLTPDSLARLVRRTHEAAPLEQGP